MKVLIAFASKHGATGEIADALVSALADTGLDAVAEAVDNVLSIAEYDAVVLGSAVYMGRWLKVAREFADQHHKELLERPVWLFSSGPLDSPAKPVEEALEVAGMTKMLHAKDHRTFAGEIDKDELCLLERAVVSIVHAPDGDYRDWQAIKDWAREIGNELMNTDRASLQGSEK